MSIVFFIIFYCSDSKHHTLIWYIILQIIKEIFNKLFQYCLLFADSI